jgi:tungstate transport system ATP-binding protein
VTAPAPVLALRGVRLRRAHGFQLDVPALDVSAGELLAVIGPNGSGKSTLLRVLGLLQAPDEGDVCFRGERVSAAGALAIRRRMAAVFQQPLLADATVADNVALGLRFRGVAGAERRARVARWLDRFGVADLAGRHARTLSGGQAQRVALARALVLEPEVLLLDEPFAALDEPTRATLLPESAAVLRAERVTTVLVTHDRGEARALADRVAVMLAGRLEQLGPTAHVFQSPVSEEVARFVGVETIVAGEVVAAESGIAMVDVDGQMLAVAADALPGERVRVCIRPEDVTLALAASGIAHSSARNHLTGTIRRVMPAAAHACVLVDCGFPLVAAVTRQSIADLGLVEGTETVAIFKASAVHVIRTALAPAPGGAVQAATHQH